MGPIIKGLEVFQKGIIWLCRLTFTAARRSLYHHTLQYLFLFLQCLFKSSVIIWTDSIDSLSLNILWGLSYMEQKIFCPSRRHRHEFFFVWDKIDFVLDNFVLSETNEIFLRQKIFHPSRKHTGIRFWNVTNNLNKVPKTEWKYFIVDENWCIEKQFGWWQFYIW